MSTKIRIDDVEVVFANLDDVGYGKSITVSAVDKDVEKAITEWVKENNIGKGDKAGVPNFKEYEGRKQYAFKINDYTRFAGLNGLTQNNLGFGAQITLIASAFEWENKFGKGVSSSLTAVLVKKAANSASDDDMAELLEDNPGASASTSTGGSGNSGYEAFKAQGNKLKDKPREDIDDEPVDLGSIPF